MAGKGESIGSGESAAGPRAPYGWLTGYQTVRPVSLYGIAEGRHDALG